MDPHYKCSYKLAKDSTLNTYWDDEMSKHYRMYRMYGFSKLCFEKLPPKNFEIQVNIQMKSMPNLPGIKNRS